MIQTVRLSLIFYTGKGTVADKLIRFWTKSPISHSEIETVDGYYCSNDPKTRVLRLAKITPVDTDWERCEIILPIEVAVRLRMYQGEKCGSRYDWEGIIFSQFFKFGFSAKKRWFCSKSNLDDLQTAVRLMKQMNKNGKYDKLLKAYTPIMAIRPSETSPARLFFYAKKCEKELRKQNLLNH